MSIKLKKYWCVLVLAKAFYGRFSRHHYWNKLVRRTKYIYVYVYIYVYAYVYIYMQKAKKWISLEKDKDLFNVSIESFFFNLGKIIFMWKHEHGSDILVDLGIVVM